MKKILFALTLLTFMFGGVSFAVDSPGEPGIIKRQMGTSQDTTVREYKLVRYADQRLNQGSLSADSLVVWDTLSDDGVTIRETTTSGDGAIAGIVVTTIPTSDALTGTSAADDAGRRNWGYIQVSGKAIVRLATGGGNSFVSGDVLITSRDASRGTTLESFIVSPDVTQAPNAAAYSTSIGTNIRRQLQASGRNAGFFLDASNDQATQTGTAEVILELN